MNITVPATKKHPETIVQVDPQGYVRWAGQLIGRVWSGTSSESPYDAWTTVWHAEVRDASGKRISSFHGRHFPARFQKNTRRGALAHLTTVAMEGPMNCYFLWDRNL